MTDILSPDFSLKPRVRRASRLLDKTQNGIQGNALPPARIAPGRDVQVDSLISYWHALREAGSVPRRSDMDPRRIQSLLPYSFILEQIAPGLARFRVAGTDLSDLMGMDVRGMPLSCFFLPNARSSLSTHLEAVFDAPGILYATLKGPGQLRRPGIMADMVVLPLRGEDNEVTRAIGCLIARGPSGLPPRRFEIQDMRVEHLKPATRVTSPVAEVKALTPATTGSHLRLVVSN